MGNTIDKSFSDAKAIEFYLYGNLHYKNEFSANGFFPINMTVVFNVNKHVIGTN